MCRKRLSLIWISSDIDPPLAKSIAMGDTCPITRLPMIDINTEFNPRACKKPLPQVSVSPSKSRKTKGKMRGQSPTGGILSFFGMLYRFYFKDLKVKFKHFRA